jgi:hypothetical protein
MQHTQQTGLAAVFHGETFDAVVFGSLFWARPCGPFSFVLLLFNAEHGPCRRAPCDTISHRCTIDI